MGRGGEGEGETGEGETGEGETEPSFPNLRMLVHSGI